MSLNPQLKVIHTILEETEFHECHSKAFELKAKSFGTLINSSIMI